jgi:hypothetical protein
LKGIKSRSGIGKLDRDRELRRGREIGNLEREIRAGVKERELSRLNPTNTCGF